LTSSIEGLATLGYLSTTVVPDPLYINNLYVTSNLYYNSQQQPVIQFGKCNGTYNSNGYGSIGVSITNYGNTNYVINITDNSTTSNGNPLIFWKANATDSNSFTAYWAIISPAIETPDPKFYWNTMGYVGSN
jgi:FlaG/FlaF family flagellin (archaellin)